MMLLRTNTKGYLQHDVNAEKCLNCKAAMQGQMCQQSGFVEIFEY
jgi:hypothetical protein